MLSAADISVGARVQQVATNVWDVVSWPESDLAADMGWNLGWLTMTLFALKLVTVGLSAESKARPFFNRR